MRVVLSIPLKLPEKLVALLAFSALRGTASRLVLFTVWLVLT